MNNTPLTDNIFGSKAIEERRVGHGAEQLCRQLEAALMLACNRIADSGTYEDAQTEDNWKDHFLSLANAAIRHGEDVAPHSRES